QRRGRVAARVRNERALRREELRQAVAPRARLRMFEAVPLGVEARVAQAVRAREVDDHVGLWRVEGRGLLVAEAEENDVGAGCERILVRDERRQASVEPRVERGGALPGERVGAERYRLQRRVREDAIQGFLTGVS